LFVGAGGKWAGLNLKKGISIFGTRTWKEQAWASELPKMKTGGYFLRLKGGVNT